jgi:hypothetical protein
MQDIISQGAAYFRQQADKHLSVQVEYKGLGSLVPLSVPAMVGMTRHDSMDQAGSITRIESRDFFISTDYLSAVPKKGDRVIEPDGTAYEVFAPFNSNAWVWADRQQKIRKIHTQLVP